MLRVPGPLEEVHALVRASVNERRGERESVSDSQHEARHSTQSVMQKRLLIQVQTSEKHRRIRRNNSKATRDRDTKEGS